MSKTFKYIGQIFKQREKGLSCIQFLAPAEDIDEWGGVPQKSSRFMKGYQRAEDEARVDDVSDFFELEENISPTAIIVAFRPNQARRLELKAWSRLVSKSYCPMY